MATLKGQRLGPKAVTINVMILWVTYSDTKSASQEKKGREKTHEISHLLRLFYQTVDSANSF